MTPTDSSPPDFEAECLRWLPDLARYARSLARDDDVADDLVQDTYLIAFKAWHQFIPGSESRGWLFTICRNRFYRVHGREARQVAADTPELETLAASALFASASHQGLGDVFEQEEVVRAVGAAMAALPETYREVALLIDMHDHTYESAARILEIPVGTVRSRLFRARRLLQEQLLTHARDLGFGVARPSSDAREGRT